MPRLLPLKIGGSGMKTIIFYSTTDGHTQTIAQTMAKDWQGDVVVEPFERFDEYVESSEVSTVVIGASIRYGHFNRDVQKKIKLHKQWLNSIQSAFFSVNLTARKPGKDDPAKSPYVQKFVKATGWVPDHLAMFAGKLVYPRYRFVDKQMIRFIMKITGGCSDGKSTIEYTNWSEVLRFSKTISGLSSR
jgi:menaquinone-dependent protoporphyrinogen oxidase